MLARAWRETIRTAAVLLLALTFVSPALAELGCIEGCVTHLAASAGDVADASQSGQQDDDGSPGDPGPCAFGQGSHCAAAQPSASQAWPVQDSAGSFSGLPTLPLTAASRDGPDRPPRP